MSTRSSSSLECLESRIAPATLVSPKVITFQDVDGDLVTIKASKPIFDSVATANAILKFASGTVTDPSSTSNDLGQQLQLITLTDADFQGVNLTVTAKRTADGGDGYVDIGAIAATGVDLGVIKLAGDLGQIDAGDAIAATPAVKALTVQSMGLRGLTTQVAGGSLASALNGGLGALTVASHLQDISLTIAGGSLDTPEAGGLGKLTVGGSIIGNVANSGLIDVSGKIGSVFIKGDLQGGTGNLSGRIEADGTIGNVTILGSILGHTGTSSGSLVSLDSLGNVKVGRDLQGGGGDGSGQIDGSYLIKSVTIGGSMIGNDGEESGAIRAEEFNGQIQKITVGRDVLGGDGDESAYIHAGASLGPIKIGGSVRGGAGDISALIYGGSAIVAPHFMTSVTIGGDLIGGTGLSSGSIGTAFNTAGINSDLTVGKILIKGSVIGVGLQSASFTGGTVKSITINGDLQGGDSSSANIFASTSIGLLKIGGSIKGGDGSFSAYISGPKIGTVQIGRDLQGGAGQDSGEIGLFGKGVQSVTIGGSVRSGGGSQSGSILVQGTIGNLAIKGSVVGTATSPVFLRASGLQSLPAPFANSAEAELNDILIGLEAARTSVGPTAIGKISIGGSATYLRVQGGYSSSATTAQTADVTLGSISVGGDWTASSVTAGVNAGGDGYYGGTDDTLASNNDTAIFSRIASISIKGRVLGTAGTDSFGFVAEQIGQITVGKVKYAPLDANNPFVSLTSTGDVTARLVNAPVNM